VEQTAYEHWHRMLFARFLAENELLIHPEMKVAVTLEECAELAAAEGGVDAWDLAGRYASRMLPQIFRPDDPVLAVRLAAEHQQELERLLASLPVELFRASDSLGWSYQFWQARRKREINSSEVKIGADELPAMTQLFTEPYMVQFLLQNTLGAWWVGAGRALPVEMLYLRRLDDGTPAAGSFDGWPRLARELKVLDPCCGSGHFLVAAFEILVSFRMAEEGLSAREACDAVLRDNLYGLEIDYRCVQIAAFALALAAWTYHGAGGYRPLAGMKLACSGLAISAKKEDWERLAGDNMQLKAGMAQMWELFREAPLLGSLVDPARSHAANLLMASPTELESRLRLALEREGPGVIDAEEHETRVSASGTTQAAALLADCYHLTATNVPFLTEIRYSPDLKNYIEDHYELGRPNLATVMAERMRRFVGDTGTVAYVCPQSWMYLKRYCAFRESVLRLGVVRIIARLGDGAFQSVSANGEPITLCVLSAPGQVGQAAYAVDVGTCSPFSAKANELPSRPLLSVDPREQLERRDCVISLHPRVSGSTVGDYCSAFRGASTSDSPRFIRRFWEVDLAGAARVSWAFLHTTTPVTAPFAGMTDIVLWEREQGHLFRLAESVKHLNHGAQNWRRGKPNWGKRGVVISQMGTLNSSLYQGDIYDDNCTAIVPDDQSLVPALWAYCSSGEMQIEVRKFNQKRSVEVGTFLAAPFDVHHWLEVVEKNGELPEPRSADPTQWIFAGHPRDSKAPLQVAVARLLGFRWPDQKPDALDVHADADGIVCLPAVRNEGPAAGRLADLLAAAWGNDWHPQCITDLLATVGHKGSLEEWLRDVFFKQHCELFHRPFIWHVWDGHREGFSALVGYHKLDHETLKSLTYSYLGDWIRTQELETVAGKSGAGDKLAKAKALQQRLAAVLEGEEPLDIFVRWKPIDKQPIGWQPDLDDGVRINIRPFMSAADVGLRGAGVLRCKPSITWGVDRGKNLPGSPWGEVRNNDVHLTIAEKRTGREAK
jgi:hypothetical protein